MPRTAGKEAGRSGSQRITECGFPKMIEDKTSVIPCAEDHDLAEKAWCVCKRFVTRLPPANAAGNEGQPFSMFLFWQHALHDP